MLVKVCTLLNVSGLVDALAVLHEFQLFELFEPESLSKDMQNCIKQKMASVTFLS